MRLPSLQARELKEARNCNDVLFFASFEISLKLSETILFVLSNSYALSTHFRICVNYNLDLPLDWIADEQI